MSRPRSALRIGIGGALAGALGLVQGASGQVGGEPAGLRLVVDYSLGVDIDTNRRLRETSEGTYAALVNGFEFALLSNTRNETFALTFGTDFRVVSDLADDEEATLYEWAEPAFNLQYSRQSANARLGLAANLQTRDVDTVEPFFIDLDGDTIIDETGFDEAEGTLTEVGASVTLETGINDPLGMTYTASYQSRTYSDTIDPALYDREEYRLGVTSRLRFSDLTTGRVSASIREYEYSDGRELTGESATVSVGLTQAVSPILTFDATLGYSKLREEEVIEGQTFIDEEQGPNFSARLSREVPDGSYFVAYRRDLINDEFRNNLSFGRSLTMPGYQLSGSLGVSALDGGEPAPTFDLIYTRQLPDGQFTASLRRAVTVTTEDEERVLTSAIAGYSYRINDLSSFNLGFDYALVTATDDQQGDEEETRATVTATYRRAITRDWNLSVGYRGRSRSTTTEDAFSSAVFLNVGRRFILRP